MAESNSSFQLFFTQLSAVAPSLERFLKQHTSRVTASISSHDAVGSYGTSFTCHVFFEVLIERCKNCGETQFSEPHFDCKYHKFERKWEVMIDAEGMDVEGALRAIERKIGNAEAGIYDERQGRVRALSRTASKDFRDGKVQGDAECRRSWI